MGLVCEQTAIPGVRLFSPRIHGDKRGFFLQTYHAKEYTAAGLDRVVKKQGGLFASPAFLAAAMALFSAAVTAVFSRLLDLLWRPRPAGGR